MNEQLFIPEKIKVGYQERADTYTKKLGYVIYYDNKGVLRKEKSWRGWIDKGSDGKEWKNGQYVINPDKIRGPLDTDDFSNEPIEGFVINRGGGGVRESWGWNTRHEFVRVFDPRGFEFEISIANLLYILQESNSIKGKGLEGEFVYAWAGPTLCLLPVNSAEYKKCEVYTKLQDGKVGTKDLVAGCIYETKKQEKLIYMGKFPWHIIKNNYRKNDTEVDKYTYQTKPQFIFVKPNKDNDYSNGQIDIVVLPGLTSFASRLTTESVDEYATMMDILRKNKHMSKVVRLVSKPADELKMIKHSYQNYMQFEAGQGIYTHLGGDNYMQHMISTETKHNYTSNKTEVLGHHLRDYAECGFREKLQPYKRYVQNNNRGYSSSFFDFNKPKLHTEEQIKAMKFLYLYVELESGALIPFNQFI